MMRWMGVALSRFDWRVLPVIAALTLGMTEGIWGVLQLCDITESGHSRYLVTGSFYNPGPFGCLVGCIFPLALHCYLNPRVKWMKWVAMVYMLVCCLLMPGSMSRTGWIAAFAGSIVVLVGVYHNRLRTVKCRYWVAGGSMAIVMAGASCNAMYHMKKDSADGRMHMWKVAAMAVLDAPIDGVGWDNVAGAYGDAQEEYFEDGTADEQAVKVAGTPEYVFNEYLQIAIAFGIPYGLLFLIAMLAACLVYVHSRLYGMGGLTMGIMVTCMASYPLQFDVFRWFIGLNMMFALMLIGNRWLRAIAAGTCLVAFILFMCNIERSDIYDSFARANIAHQNGQYRESVDRFKALLPKTSDPMPLNIMGKCYQSLGLRDSAEYCYRRSTNRVPNRFYPHYLLMLLYAEEPSDSLKMQAEARYLLMTRPKTPSMAIDEMRDKAREILAIDSPMVTNACLQ